MKICGFFCFEMKIDQSKHTIPSETGRRLGYTLYHPDSLKTDNNEKRQLMIFAHGFKGFAEWGFIPYVCKQHAKNGIEAVAIDFSMNGVIESHKPIYDPEVFAANTVSIMLAELHLLIDHLKDKFTSDQSLQKQLQITLAGHSLGAALSLIIAAEREDIKNLSLWGTVGTLNRNTPRQKALWKEKGKIEFSSQPGGQKLWQNYSYLEDKEQNMDRLDLIKRAGEYKGQLLVIHGESDVTTRVKEGQSLYEAAKPRNKAKIIIIPKTGHTFNSFHPLQEPPPASVVEGTKKMIDMILGID